MLRRPGLWLRVDQPVTQSIFDTRWRAFIKSRRQASCARVISRAASTSTGGTTTPVNEPASNSRASNSASLRSVLTRSEGPRGVLPGAITCIPIPAAVAARYSPKPVGPPHNTPSPDLATPTAIPQHPPTPHRTASASTLPSANQSPPRVSSGHGHQAPPTSSLPAWPDLLISWGQPEPSLRPDKPPRGVSGHHTPAVNPPGRPRHRV